MEIYFNPYPGPAGTEEESMHLAIGTADALLRLQKECIGTFFSAKMAVTDGNLPPSQFILFRNNNLELNIAAIMFKTSNVEREKLRLLLNYFNKGKIIGADELNNVDDWIISNINAPAPVLELAAKNKAITLTIPTEDDWKINIINFIGRQEILHNLWGQENLSAIVIHCLESIRKIPERFSIRFNALFCSSALNSAPDFALWMNYGFFQTMERAKKRNYQPDDNLIKVVSDTQYGALLELRLYGSGHRLFFTHRKGCLPEILIGGFYKKNQSLSQNDAIKHAKKCIDQYSGE